MKKIGKFSVSFTTMMLLANNNVYAASEAVAEEGIPSKYIFIGIAALVIVLLLFLGYRMDTKGEEVTNYKPSKKIKQKPVKNKMAKKEEVYEEDNINYEVDNNVNTDDLMDSTEYEDDEDSLFTTTSNAKSNDESLFSTMSNDKESDNDFEDEYDEEEGEEFDTSIIDNIDNEDEDIKIAPKSFDETMIFDKPITNTNLEDEIDSLDNIEDVNVEPEKDPFIEELNNFKEPESTFEGFSVADDEIIETENVKPNKVAKKYTKVKKVENVEDVPVDENFLNEMEENLQRNKENRGGKDSAKKTTTRKKKE